MVSVPDPDVFFLSIQPDSEFDYYLSDDPSATKESVIARLEHLAGHIRGQLEEQLGAQLVEFGVVLDWITAYPTLGGDGKNLSRLMTKSTKWHVQPGKTQISLGIRPV